MSARIQTKHAVGLGLLLGIVSFWMLFGFERALGIAPSYTWPMGDQAQHIAGAYAYLDGKWGFPLFTTDRINQPAGVNIIFTDSAPFAGLLAKLLYSLTGIRFNYLGAWFCILWVGQATAGAYLFKQFCPRHPVMYVCGAIFALAWPAFLIRHFHLALGSHFLLLLSLGFYFSAQRAKSPWSQVMLWTPLLGVALWTHAYLFVMCFAIFLAAQTDYFRTHPASRIHVVGSAAFVVISCVTLGLIGGYQTVGNVNAVGYGAFRLDLVAYVWPHGSAVFKAPNILDPQSAFEGFNYLGLGGILIIISGLLLIRSRHLSSIWRQHRGLTICIIGMLAFAVTNLISVGGHVVLNLPISTAGFPFSTFRASGRFGWTFGYVLVFCGLGIVARTIWDYSRAAAIGAVSLLCAIQVWDTTALLKGMQEGGRSTPKPMFEAAIQRAEIVIFSPPIDCLPVGPVQTSAIEVLAISARLGKPTNSAHTARVGELDCDARQSISKGDLVVADPNGGAATHYRSAMRCTTEAGLLLCN